MSKFKVGDREDDVLLILLLALAFGLVETYWRD